MELAKPGDPMITGSGKVIEASDVSEQERFAMVEDRKVLPSFARMAVLTKLNTDTLPEPDFQQQTIIAAVIGLKLMGLSNPDIADVLSTNIENVERFIRMPATQSSFENVYQNIINNNSDLLQGRIASYGNSAVDTVVSLMTNTETRDDVRLKASQDILDRIGTNPDQFFGVKSAGQQQDDELRIVIMDESGENERVKVDIRRKG